MTTISEAQLRQLIQETLLEILGYEAPSRPKPEPNTALVLFTGALLGFEDALESLRRIKELGFDLSYTQTDSAKHILDQDKIAALGMTERSKSLVGNHELLIVPTTTVNLIAKCANGIADGLGPNVLAEFIQSGRPVVAAFTGACPDSKEKRTIYPDMPEAYREVLRQNLRTVRSFGVTLVGADQLDIGVKQALGRRDSSNAPASACASPAAKVIDCKSKLLSFKDVRVLPTGSVIRIMPSTIVTALARDAAAAQDITIEVKG